MRSRSLLSAITTAVAVSTAARSIAAQQTTPTAPANAVTVDQPRIVATYSFGNRPADTAFPRFVTVTDSAGTLIARAALAGEAREIPMVAIVLDSDLVLQGQTATGVLTLVIDRQNEMADKQIVTGRWMMGKTGGTLRFRAKN